MNIRPEQFETFAQASARKFEEQMVAHAREFAPKHCEVLGEDGTRAVVRKGIDGARKYGFTSRGPVQLYLDLMFVLGSDFDLDPQYPWAWQVLVDPGIPGQVPRADRLWERAGQYLDRVAGPENAFAIESLRRLKGVDEAKLRSTPADAARIIGGLRAMYPQKCDYLGDAGLQALAMRASLRAQARAITTQAGTLLFAALEFSLGHGFERDPLYPWIGSTLSDPLVTDPNDRVTRLYEKTMIYVDRALAYLEKK